MPKFNLERLLDDVGSGRVSHFDLLIDPAHNGKPTAIDLSVTFPGGGGRKYKELGGVEELRGQLPYLQDGQHWGF